MTKSISATAVRPITRRILVAEDNKTIQEMVFRFLFKPFKLEDLQRKVQGVLASREREHGSYGRGNIFCVFPKDRK